MKAAIYTRSGSPDVVRITDVKKPVPKGDEVLIKVRAASVNPIDWHFMRGTPYAMRMMVGLRKPKDKRLGSNNAARTLLIALRKAGELDRLASLVAQVDSFRTIN